MGTDDNINSIQEGHTARVIREQTEDYLLEREDSILNTLVGLYKAGTLTNETLRGSIGEIAGLRDFRGELQSKIRRGVTAAEKELGNG